MMVMTLWDLTATLILLAGVAAGIPQECLVSRNVKIPWLSPTAEVQAWVDQTSLQSSTTVPAPALQINITLVGEDGLSYHLVHLNAESTRVTEGPDAVPVHDSRRKMAMTGGWVNISVAIYDNVTIREVGETAEEEVLVSYPLQQTVKDIAVSGSNITVNCHSGVSVWRVGGGSGASKFIPLTLRSGPAHLAIYAQQPILPALRLTGGRIFTLGMFDGRPTTLIYLSTTTTSNTSTTTVTTTQPLPPFTLHHLTIDCSHHHHQGDLSCNIMMNHEVLETASFTDLPLSLEVVGTRGDSSRAPFLLLQYNDSPLPPSPITTTTTATPPPPSSTTTVSTTQGGGGPQPPTPKTDAGGSLSYSGYVVMPEGWSGWWVFMALILAILLIFVVIMCFISHYHRPKIEKYFGGMLTLMEGAEGESEGEDDDEDMGVEHSESRPLFGRSISMINTHDPKSAGPLRLWNAVASGEENEVEQVVETLGPDPLAPFGGRDTSPYQEAHSRGHVNVLSVLEAFMKRRPDVPHNDMILGVLQAHSKKVEEVFAAAQGGQYRHSGGVDVLLRAHSLPGTIQDSCGRSLLHYAGSMALADSGPLWLANDVTNLVETHRVYVNALDFAGRTALHALAEKASVSDQQTCWAGRTLSVNEAWLAMAEQLLTLGTNPALPDHTSATPSHLAAKSENQHLATFLLKAEGERSNDGGGCPLERCRLLVDAAGRGQVDAMTDLLVSGVGTVLPLGSRLDPLLAAVQNGHRDAVFLLLSAGAPLCAQGLLGNTPFQACHSTIGLPALFPALIRKAFCDQLDYEADSLIGNEEVVVLREGLGHLRTIAELSGHRLGEELGTWLKRWPTSGTATTATYMNMLAMASSHGLTLTCQLLSVAGVRLNPLPRQPHPLANALEASHHDTAYSLCRDLKMNPFTFSSPPSSLPPRLLNHLLLSELQKFERKLSKKEVESGAAQDLLECARGQRTSRTHKQLTTFLYLLAELDLVTILHQLRESQDNVDINAVVHIASGATMLHVAAAYGKILMVEYLLGQSADHTQHTYGGLAPVHVAAIRGHRACVEYIVSYTGTELGCSNGLTPSLMLQHFADNVKRRHLDLLTCQEAATVTATKGDQAKAHLILSGRFNKLGIKSSTSLFEALLEEEKKMESLIIPELENSIQNDVLLLCNQMANVDGRLQGDLVFCSPLKEKSELLLPENFDFCLELASYTGLSDGCILLKESKDNGQPGGGHTVEISSTQDPELFSDENFKSCFSKAAHEALCAIKFKSLALVPPFLAHTTTGVCIHAAYNSKQRVMLVRVNVSPVIKVPRPKWISEKLPRRFAVKSEPNKSHEHLVNVSEGIWTYQFNITLRSVLSRVNETEHKVIQACLYLRKLLETCWWLPKQDERKQGRTWQTYPVGVNFPTMPTLLTHFLEELASNGERNGWGRDQFLDRVVAVLRRSTSSSAMQRTKIIMPRQWEDRLSNSIEATIQFLLDLQHSNTENGRTNSVSSRQ